MRIGIFGGTFNPIHFGHLIPLEEIREKFSFDIIYFILAKIPPHKMKQHIIPAKERYLLLKKAIKSNKFFKPSSIELRRKGPSYSLFTINYFLKKFIEDELFLIIGSDAFLDITSWYKYENVLKSIDFIVMIREGKNLPEKFLKNLGYFPSENNYNLWINNFGKKIIISQVKRIDISSSLIRDNLFTGKSARYLLPENCLKYINKKNFYKRKEDNEL